MVGGHTSCIAGGQIKERGELEDHAKHGKLISWSFFVGEMRHGTRWQGTEELGRPWRKSSARMKAERSTSER